MARVRGAFYGQPQIQTLLKGFMKTSCEHLPIGHLKSEFECIWIPVFEEKALAELLGSNYPVLGFLKSTLIFLVELTTARLEKELIEINAIRQTLGKRSFRSNSGEVMKTTITEEEFQSRCSIYNLRHNAATQCALNCLVLVSNLLRMKGTTVIRVGGACNETTASSIPKITSVTTGDDSDDELTTTGQGKAKKSSASAPVNPLDPKLMEVKYMIFSDEQILSTLLGACGRLLTFPNVQVVSEAFRILRAYVRQATKNFAPIHPCTPKLIMGVHQLSLTSIFVPPPFDPMILGTVAAPSPSALPSTPLQEFWAGFRDSKNTITNHIVATIYESLKGLLRYDDGKKKCDFDFGYKD